MITASHLSNSHIKGTRIKYKGLNCMYWSLPTLYKPTNIPQLTELILPRTQTLLEYTGQGPNQVRSRLVTGVSTDVIKVCVTSRVKW